MGAAPKVAVNLQRYAPVFFFGKLPKSDHHFSGREPSGLFERMKKIALVEGGAVAGAGEETALPINSVRAWLALWGADLHEWMQKNESALMHAAKSEAMYPQQVIFKLLDEALEAREAKLKKPKK